MTLLQCGCEQDGSARCDWHEMWGCHDGLINEEWRHPEGDRINVVQTWCPPCRIAKWRSVSLSSAATPTRGKR